MSVKKRCKCGKLAVKHRTECQACRMRKYRERHPIKAAYNTLRDNARRRGKDFSLTLEQFRKFCRKNRYMEGKGREAACLSIDRINNKRGYEPENIAILTVSQNSIKANCEKNNLPWLQPSTEICPF